MFLSNPSYYFKDLLMKFRMKSKLLNHIQKFCFSSDTEKEEDSEEESSSLLNLSC